MMRLSREGLDYLVSVMTTVDHESLAKLGIGIGKLYTDRGLPIDVSLGHLNMGKEQKTAVLFGAQQWFIEHRRNSGADEKALDRQRQVNHDAMERFMKSGETGIY